MSRTRVLLAGALALAVLAGCRGRARHVSYSGVLEGISVHVPALTGGRLDTLFVDQGSEVAAGDRIAIMDTTELVLARRQAEAALEDLRVQSEIADVNLNRTRTDLAYMQERQVRIKALFDQQAASRQDLDDIANRLATAQAAYDAADKQVQSLAAKRKQAEAQVQTVRKRLSDAVLVAPRQGTITTLYYEAGEAVPPLAPVVELVHVRELEVRVYVPERRLAELRIGQEAAIVVDGVRERLTGTVVWVSPKAEFTPRTVLTPETRTALVYAVKVLVPNPRGILKHGMPVTVIL